MIWPYHKNCCNHKWSTPISDSEYLALFETVDEIKKDLLIEDLQEIDKRFDIVISSEVIEHVEEPWAFTAYCSNLVKEDGDLIMTTVNRTQVRL